MDLVISSQEETENTVATTKMARKRQVLPVTLTHNLEVVSVVVLLLLEQRNCASLSIVTFYDNITICSMNTIFAFMYCMNNSRTIFAFMYCLYNSRSSIMNANSIESLVKVTFRKTSPSYSIDFIVQHRVFQTCEYVDTMR